MKYKSVFLMLMFFVKSFYGQKDFKSAEKMFSQEQFNNALSLYKKAYTDAKEDQQPLIGFKVAECYRMIGDYNQAEEWYTKAIKANYTDPKAMLYLADVKKSLGKYEEAIVEYGNYKTAEPSDPLGQNGIKSCEMARKWHTAPTGFKVENMASINSPDDDFSPSYADKKYNKLYFTSTRPGTSKATTDDGKNNSDLFQTLPDKSNKWSAPVALPEPVNTKHSEGGSVVFKKTEALYFTRCNNQSKNSQIWFAEKKGPLWAEPVKIEFCLEDIRYASPCISADGMMLFFSSNMPGGQGDNDIWISEYDKTGKKWGAPTNLGPDINTPGNEDYPFIHDDGTLYFSSTGYLGMGGLDIFKAEKKEETKWDNVTNMKYPINSGGDDFGIIFDGNKKGYLASNREGTKGGQDIWSFIDAPLLFTIEGIITDCQSKGTIAGVSVRLTGSDGTTTYAKTDMSGYYQFAENSSTGERCVNAYTSYVISINHNPSLITSESPEGYFKNETPAKQSTVGINENKTFKHDFCLTAKPFTPAPVEDEDAGDTEIEE